MESLVNVTSQSIVDIINQGLTLLLHTGIINALLTYLPESLDVNEHASGYFSAPLGSIGNLVLSGSYNVALDTINIPRCEVSTCVLSRHVDYGPLLSCVLDIKGALHAYLTITTKLTVFGYTTHGTIIQDGSSLRNFKTNYLKAAFTFAPGSASSVETSQLTLVPSLTSITGPNNEPFTMSVYKIKPGYITFSPGFNFVTKNAEPIIQRELAKLFTRALTTPLSPQRLTIQKALYKAIQLYKTIEHGQQQLQTEEEEKVTRIE